MIYFGRAPRTVNLDNVEAPTGYRCPWCRVIVDGAGVKDALELFESHCDVHETQGDVLPQRNEAGRITAVDVWAVILSLPLLWIVVESFYRY